jgi:metal-dependent amidase/aminoacylase/carboxypeptidase family protein
MSPDELRDDLIRLSREINADPELAYQEHRAVGRIATLLEKHGHQVERNLGGLATAFRARVGPPGPAVALLAEYDALPEVGHGCGHNLISMTNVGAFLKAAANATDLQIGIELVGTPAEESGGGKIDLLDKGVFKNTVAVLSSASRRRW